MFRIGFGYDSHAFCEGDRIMLGGVSIPYSRGIRSHSDGDVLFHAVGDALLGAAALGDLGHLFPDNDPLYKDVDSAGLLVEIRNRLVEKTYRVNNIDATIVAEAPKLASHILTMRKNTASALNVAVSSVSVKATTNEKMGWIGRGEGIAAHAVVLIESTEDNDLK